MRGKNRNLKSGGFDVIKTFENYKFKDMRGGQYDGLLRPVRACLASRIPHKEGEI
jgi:hypothetical protein